MTGLTMLDAYGLNFQLIVATGMIAALIVWALPRNDEWIGFVFVTAGLALLTASLILALT